MRLPVDAIYFISLPKAAVRRRKLIEHFTRIGLTDKYGITPQWHLASDGNHIDFGVDNSVKLTAKRPKISLSELGCIHSHRQLWTKCVQSDYEYMLILEDDADFNYEKTYNLAQHWDKLPDFDFLHLGWENYKAYVEQVIEEHPIAELPDFWKGNGMWLTHAYIINKYAAELLLEKTNPAYNGLDGMTAGLQSEMESYGFKPGICNQKQNQSGLLRSQIIHTG